MGNPRSLALARVPSWHNLIGTTETVCGKIPSSATESTLAAGGKSAPGAASAKLTTSNKESKNEFFRKL